MFRTFIVDKIIRESETIKSFYFVPKDGGQLDRFLPGQHVPVQVRIQEGTDALVRNYTLSNSPETSYYRLTIKLESQGKVSRYLHSSLAVGDEIELGSPKGNFNLSIGSKRAVVLMSGGVGITPMMSMMEYLVQNEPDRKLYFIHSSVNAKVQPMTKRLLELKEKLADAHISIHHTKPDENEKFGTDYDYKGLIEKPFLQSILTEVEAEYYLCGPIGFMEAMYCYLAEIDVSSSDIHYESFGEGKILGDRPVFRDSSSPGHTVYFEKSKKKAEWNENTLSILELAEVNGLSPAFSCRMGSCSTCETNIKSGSVTYEPEPFVHIPKDKILTCCSRPTSDIVIEI